MNPLTEQQRQDVSAHEGTPVPVVDQQTQRVYYIISAEQFDRVCAPLVEADFSPREFYPLIAKTAGEAGWNDTAMTLTITTMSTGLKISRGDVVLLPSRLSREGSEVRPALVVQDDGLNARLTSTIVAIITTTNPAGAHVEPSQLFIDINTPEGRQTGCCTTRP